ncbi:hypothetical protein B5X24_HaOG200058 [Helicoverpa armigera]|nr:hypothetical protein B5X24_HaOG200058 [Helicoverpa armigera]
MLVEILVCFSIVLLLYQRWVKRDIYKLGAQLNSGVRTFPFIGHSYLFFGDNHARMNGFQTLGRDAISKENGLTSMWHGNHLFTMIADAEAAEFVLKTCLEKDDIMKLSTLFVGNGSIFAPVSIWRPRRKILVPCFGTRNLKTFMSIFVKQSAILVNRIGKMAGTGPLSAWKYYTAYTMDAIAESTLGYQMGAQNDTRHPFLKAVEDGLARNAERVCQPWLHSDLVYTNLPIYPKLVAYKDFMWDFVLKLIKAKREEIKENDEIQKANEGSSERTSSTFMESLITISGGDGGYTDVEIIEELMVIMVAGNDTSAVGSSFVSLMLSRYPDVQEKVYEELQEVFGDSDRAATFEDLPRLKYLDAVIRETLRLYPPVPVITRKIVEEVTLPSGIKIVPGSGIIVNIWALHRNPRYWGCDAEQFRPERFLDAPPTHPAAFMPFSHGPRNCVGYQYAMTSMKTVVSSLLRRYKLLPATAPNEKGTHRPIRLKFDLMMKDDDDFQIQIEARS